MYERFQIETSPAPDLVPRPEKFNVRVKKLRLAKMLLHETLHYRFNRKVVLSRPCIYGVFSGRLGGFKPIKGKCVGCLRCVQEYPKILTVEPSAKYKGLGDSYWTPDGVFTVWNEASTGRIPVKGMGYKGSFAGEGFDSIWTDMSEIVRPTRDGVYGREFISTVVDLGRKPKRLQFNGVSSTGYPIRRLSLPIIFDLLPSQVVNDGIRLSIAEASKRLGVLFVCDSLEEHPLLNEYSSNAITFVERTQDSHKSSRIHNRPRARASEPILIEYQDSEDLTIPFEHDETSIIGVRLLLDENAKSRAVDLVKLGVGFLHLCANYQGRDYSPSKLHVKDALHQVHSRLVEEGVRDEVTLIVSGGITLAEHVPKAIIRGADIVAIDTSVLVALQAEFRGEGVSAENSPVRFHPLTVQWGSQRLVNLLAAWHDQLIEILSAMGMRDVRRLRGDIGRSMSNEELEKESFGDIECKA